jgi:hypothetical protein
MLKIVLVKNCSERLELLKNVSWIRIGESSEPCDVFIGESIANVPETVMQIIFSENEFGNILNIYSSSYKNSLNDYLDFICECIRNKIAVHVFGDSHSIITHKVTICRENWLGFNTNYPITMNRFAKEGLDLHECIRVMGNGHEKYPIRENDIAMYSYGEVDVRYLILKHSNMETVRNSWQIDNTTTCTELKEMVHSLITNYVQKIKENEMRFKCKSFVYFLIPPFDNPSDVTTGTLNDRKKLYDYVTKNLYKLCEENNIGIISLYNHIADSNGFCKTEYLRDPRDIHIHNDFYYLVRDAIMNKLTNSVSA